MAGGHGSGTEGAALASGDERLRPGPGPRTTTGTVPCAPTPTDRGNRGLPRGGPIPAALHRRAAEPGRPLPAACLGRARRRDRGCSGAPGETGRGGTARNGAGPFAPPSTSPSGSRCPVPGARRVRASRPRLRPSPERGRARRGGGAGGRCQPIVARGLLRSSQWQRAAGIPGGRDPGGAHGSRVGRSRECGVEWARGLARVRTQRRGWRGREG